MRTKGATRPRNSAVAGMVKYFWLVCLDELFSARASGHRVVFTVL